MTLSLVSYRLDYVEESGAGAFTVHLACHCHFSNSCCLCRRRTGWILFGLSERTVENPRRSFPNSLPATLISCCPVVLVGTDREWFAQPSGPLLAWTSRLSSTTQMCMFSPSWPHYITSTNLSNNQTRNDAQPPETQQLLEPPLPFLFVLPLPSASLFPPPFFHS